MIRAHSLRGILLAMMVFVGSPSLAGSLQDAIVTGDVERVGLEIARGADVNEADLVLGLPLMIAAQGDHIAIAVLLVAHGANVNGEGITGTPLHTAALAGHTAMVEFLVIVWVLM